MGPESALERAFNRKVRLLGGLSIKFAPTVKGVPDRIVIMPRTGIHLVEMKAQTGLLSASQTLMHERIQKMGVRVWVLRSEKDMDRFFRVAADLAYARHEAAEREAAKQKQARSVSRLV